MGLRYAGVVFWVVVPKLILMSIWYLKPSFYVAGGSYAGFRHAGGRFVGCG